MTDLARRLDDLEAMYGELREEHAAGNLAKLQDRYAGDPVGFIQSVLGARLWERQVAIAELVRDHPQVVVQSCNGAGKDHLAARLAVWAAAMGWYVLITGPTERQVKKVVMDDAYAAWSHASPRLPGQFMQLGWVIDRRSLEKNGILAFTSTDVSRITGHHAPKMLAIVTEGQGVEEETYRGIRACLTGEQTRFLVVGNPVAPEGEFYKLCRSKSWKVVKISAYDTPNVREGREVIPGMITRRFVEQQAEEYGEQSPVFVASVLGEFPERASEHALYPRALREACYARWEAGTPILAADAIGLDPSEGGDLSVGAVRGGRRVEELRVWREQDQMVLVGHARVLAERWKMRPASDAEPECGTFVIDANALGAGAAHRLREERFRVVAFKSQAAPPKPKRRQALEFGNLRAAAHWRLRELMERDLALPRDTLLDEELAAIKYQPASTGKIFIEPKQDLKKRIGRSPDRLDAVVLACWEEPGITGGGFVGSW